MAAPLSAQFNAQRLQGWNEIGQTEEFDHGAGRVEGRGHSPVVDRHTLRVGDARHVDDPVEIRVVIKFLTEPASSELRSPARRVGRNAEASRAACPKIEQLERRSCRKTRNHEIVDIRFEKHAFRFALKTVPHDPLSEGGRQVLRRIEQCEAVGLAGESRSAKAHAHRRRPIARVENTEVSARVDSDRKLPQY